MNLTLLKIYGLRLKAESVPGNQPVSKNFTISAETSGKISSQKLVDGCQKCLVKVHFPRDI